MPLDQRVTQATVLVVDDEPAIREMLGLVLEMEGFHVVTAGDGVDALRVVAKEPPAVVLTDLMMPNLDGYGLIDRLRAARVPLKGIIAMSAGSIAGARPPKADLFIAKPFDIEQVVKSIFSLLTTPPPTPVSAARANPA
jgi:CheY-like chemotaxis protein